MALSNAKWVFFFFFPSFFFLFFGVPQILGLECYDSNKLLDQSTSLLQVILFFKESFKFIIYF